MKKLSFLFAIATSLLVSTSSCKKEEVSTCDACVYGCDSAGNCKPAPAKPKTWVEVSEKLVSVSAKEKSVMTNIDNKW